MRADTRQIGNVSIIDLFGKITIGEGDVIMREKVEELLEGGKVNIIINLNKVKYMDSAGIGELVACQKRAKEKGGEVKLLNIPSKVSDVLEIVNIGGVFETYKDEKEALDSF